MKKSILALAILFIFSSALFITSNAQQGMKKGNMNKMRSQKGQMFHERMMKKLNLTDKQKEKIETLKIDHQKRMVDLQANLKKDALDLKELRVRGNITRSTLISAVKKMNESKNAIALEKANHMFDVYETLTPEQQKIWRANAPKFGERMHMRMQKRHPRMMMR